jgi:hypothetical protein
MSSKNFSRAEPDERSKAFTQRHLSYLAPAKAVARLRKTATVS